MKFLVEARITFEGLIPVEAKTEAGAKDAAERLLMEDVVLIAGLNGEADLSDIDPIPEIEIGEVRGNDAEFARRNSISKTEADKCQHKS